MSSFFEGQDSAKSEYEVGYGKPPQKYRFKEGVSGNPYGRPKHPATFIACLEREFSKKVKIRDKNRILKVTKLTALTKLISQRVFNSEDEKLLLAFIRYLAPHMDMSKELNCNYEPIFEDEKQPKDRTREITKALNAYMDEKHGVAYNDPEE